MKALIFLLAISCSFTFAKDKSIAICDGAENSEIALVKKDNSTYNLKPQVGAYHFSSRYIQDIVSVDLNLDTLSSTYLVKKLGVTNNKDLELFLLVDEETSAMKINIFSIKNENKELVESLDCDLK